MQHGIIRMQQKCYEGATWFDKDVTKVLQGPGRKKVLQGLNAVTWFNKDVAKVL